jgi:hypothetical protein
VHPEALIERLCWFVLWDKSLGLINMEKLAENVGHDRRSLKRFSKTLEKFTEEWERLETKTGHPLDSFRQGSEKLDRKARRMEPSPLLSMALDLFAGPPNTPGNRSRFLSGALTHARIRLKQHDAEMTERALKALQWLRQAGLSFEKIATLLGTAAWALGYTKDYSSDVLKMRVRRSRRTS